MHQHFRTVSNRLKVSESIPSGGHVPMLGIPCKQKSRSERRLGMRTCFFAAGWFQRRGAGAWRSHTAANPTFVAWSFCDTLRAVSNRPYFCSFFPDEHPKERSYLMTKKQKKTLKRIIISAVLYLAIILASKLVAIPWYLELVLSLVPELRRRQKPQEHQRFDGYPPRQRQPGNCRRHGKYR